MSATRRKLRFSPTAHRLTRVWKYCSKCKKVKRPGHFDKNRRRGDGLQSWCKQCSSDASKGKYLAQKTASRAPTSDREEVLRQRMDKREGAGYLRCKIIDHGFPCGSLQFLHEAAAHLAEVHDVELTSPDALDRFYDTVPTQNDDR